jgi:hypothetical protein
MKPAARLTMLACLLALAAAAAVLGAAPAGSRPSVGLLPAAVLALAPLAVAGSPLPGTAPLETDGDPAEQMVAGIERFLDRETAAAAARREERWRRDFSSALPTFTPSAISPGAARSSTWYTWWTTRTSLASRR